MSFLFSILRGSGIIALALYEYKINTYFTSFLYGTGKQTVWYGYTVPTFTTVANTILVSVFLRSVVIGNCVYFDFVFLGLCALALCPLI